MDEKKTPELPTFEFFDLRRKIAPKQWKFSPVNPKPQPQERQIQPQEEVPLVQPQHKEGSD